ncbi:Os01g0373033 [Oryza sativa Japonica Group]|uniref:Os01g0373033 protein n=1 Tax=Oryza sativa subsp. japonica TaxID=39947 RepID=A0A0P0V352_ORYSJ|nr:Os01g0373033 [Oryza sativa Japonica Group]
MAPAKPLLLDFVSAVLSRIKTKSRSKAKPETSSSNPGTNSCFLLLLPRCCQQSEAVVGVAGVAAEALAVLVV